MARSDSEKALLAPLMDKVAEKKETIGSKAVTRLIEAHKDWKSHFSKMDLTPGSSDLNTHGGKVCGALVDGVKHAENLKDHMSSLHDLHTNKLKLSKDQVQTPTSEFRRRDWERERKRLIAYELHAATLAEYHRSGRIPRGLRVNLRPTLFSEDEHYRATFEKILNKCSMDLMLLTVERLQTAVRELQLKIEGIQQQLQDSMGGEEFGHLRDKVETSLANYRKEVETKKRKKFARDAEDYRLGKVYRWQDTASGWSVGLRLTSGGYQSSGSSRSHTENRQPFLRNGKGQHPGGGRDRQATNNKQGGQMWSQTLQQR